MRICSTCSQRKDLSQFIADSRYRDGHRGQCKDCINRKRRQNKKTPKNRAKQSEYNSSWYKKRALVDPVFKLKHNIRNRINQALKAKPTSAIEALGCTPQELKEYLEEQFEPGMTWQNHTRNGWHVDHICSLAMFNLSNPEEYSKACHYSNLRPRWASENCKTRGL